MKPVALALTAALTVFALISPGAASAADGDMTARAGWGVQPTAKDYATLVRDLTAAVKANGMVVVTRAGPTKAAARRGITIPGNMVVGVFNNDFAVRVLATSTAAMIEAPIRFYVTENADGTATLSYKAPSTVFGPYMDEGGADLSALAADLDDRFAAIAAVAAN